MKNKLNTRLLNILILLMIIVIMIFIWPSVDRFIFKALTALLPLIIAFTLAYILNPTLTFLQKRKIPRWLGIIFVYSLIVGFFIYLVFGILKPAVDNIGDLTIGVERIMEQIGTILNVDTSGVTSYAKDFVQDLVNKISNFFTASGGTVESVWQAIINSAVIVVVGIIFLLTFPRIKKEIKEYLEDTLKPKAFQFVRQLDRELTNYLWAEVIIAGIQALEYGGLMLILSIFFPEFLAFVPLVAIVAAILSLIPYFGGYFSILFTAVIIMTVPNAAYGMIGLAIFTIVFPQLDAYVINPKIYQTKLRLNPIATISFVLLGQAFFGIIGAILSVPVQVVFEVTMNYYKQDIKNRLKDFNSKL
ncbi:AI-2E family transporter [Acholeplasma hippikon]|uniref:Pheromone autoinducer 2 transporter n=1 Tax=Acholeplasma hippikon TaxID=264636 RepID=A0A449BJ78_9MOLU|nr:AI-2E family transporter [Acholeplasma hippikon]VEU82514.1 pheromone autoinducer 2 transporter [Acholeplasma hippikon]